MSRETSVYRLVVEVPADPSYVPAAWLEEWGDTMSVFSWPPRRNYFSFDSAQRRALLLSRWGARVTIERCSVSAGDEIGHYVDGRALEATP